MTPEQLAARWLADVTRHYDANAERVILEADAISALARHIAPGDDLVERLQFFASGDGTVAAACAKAAARIAALTATVAETDAMLTKTAGLLKRVEDDRVEKIAKLETAEAEAARLRDRLARMEGTLVAIDAMDPEQQINGFSESALRGTVLHMGAIARAALTDGGING